VLGQESRQRLFLISTTWLRFPLDDVFRRVWTILTSSHEMSLNGGMTVESWIAGTFIVLFLFRAIRFPAFLISSRCESAGLHVKALGRLVSCVRQWKYIACRRCTTYTSNLKTVSSSVLYSSPPLVFSRALQLTRYVPSDASCLCMKVAILREQIKYRLCSTCTYIQCTTHIFIWRFPNSQLIPSCLCFSSYVISGAQTTRPN